MSWRKYNRSYTEALKNFDVWYVKLNNNGVKKFRARAWLKANRKRYKR